MKTEWPCQVSCFNAARHLANCRDSWLALRRLHPFPIFTLRQRRSDSQSCSPRLPAGDPSSLAECQCSQSQAALSAPGLAILAAVFVQQPPANPATSIPGKEQKPGMQQPAPSSSSSLVDELGCTSQESAHKNSVHVQSRDGLLHLPGSRQALRVKQQFASSAHGKNSSSWDTLLRTKNQDSRKILWGNLGSWFLVPWGRFN